MADETALKARRGVVGQELNTAGSGRPAWNSSPPTPPQCSTPPATTGTSSPPGANSCAPSARSPRNATACWGPPTTSLIPAATPTSSTGRPPRVRAEQAGLERQILESAAAAWTPPWQPSRTPKTPPPPRTSGSRPCSAPPPTAAKAWPGWPGRSAPHAPGWNRPRPKSAGCVNPSRPGRSAAGRPTRVCRPGIPGGRGGGRRGTLDADYEDASAALDAIVAEIDALKAAERDGERERGALIARRDALQLGLNRKDGSDHVLGAGIPGVLGALASMITVEPGFEAAIAAALGAASDAVVVQDGGGRGRRRAAVERRRRRTRRPAAGRRRQPQPRRTPAPRRPGGRPVGRPARHGIRRRTAPPPGCRCPDCWRASPSSTGWMTRRNWLLAART